MHEDTTEMQKSNFRDYMSMPSGDDFDCFLNALDDYGIHVGITADDFLADEEDALYNMEELGYHLEFFSRYMQAKVKGFKALRDDGIAAIFAFAECSGCLGFEYEGLKIDGAWSRNNDVLYIRYGDKVDTTVASSGKDKRFRKKADKDTATFWLKQMVDNEIKARREAAVTNEHLIA